MLIPLGILDYPVSAAAAGSYDLLETEILTGSQASVTFSSLNSTYGADYQHLQIRMTTRTTRAGDGDFIYVRFNGVTSSSYSRHQLTGNGSSVSSYGAGSVTSIPTPDTTSAGSSADRFGAVVIDILDPFETTKNTTVRAFGGANSGFNQIGLFSGAYFSTDAISSITLASGNSASVAASSRFSLYGLKASA